LTIFGCGTVAGFFITMLLFSTLDMLTMKSQDEMTLFSSLFSYVICAIVGIFVGFILQRMLKIGAAIMGAIGGYIVGIMVYNLIFFWVKSNIFLEVISVLGALVMTVLSIRQYDNIVIFGTAMLGSYCFVRGFSLFIPDSFPNESTILDKIVNLEVEFTFYIYLAVFLIIFAGGVVFQNKTRMIESKNNYIKL
jgi:hypothetical protein